jgi:hypothetical protein
MNLRVALCAGLFVLTPPGWSTEIYRWVDEAGQTHMSDVVPQKYKKSAIKVGSHQYEPTAEQKSQAEARAAKDRALVTELNEQRARTEALQAASAASAAAELRTAPRKVVDANSDCATLHRVYRESQECFAPYLVANGSRKAEAFEKCGAPILNPTYQCGPAKSD